MTHPLYMRHTHYISTNTTGCNNISSGVFLRTLRDQHAIIHFCDDLRQFPRF